MAHRDPKTGQFVAGDSMEFRDYEFQHVHSQYVVEAADLPAAFPITEEDISVYEMDDLLHRDERADLVAVQLHSAQASVPGTTSAENTLAARWELSLGTGSEMVAPTDSEIRTNEGESGVVDVSSWESDDPDILSTVSVTAEGSFADTAGGVSGGADAPVVGSELHFPRDIGACPVLDQRDEITESIFLAQIGGANISDSLVKLDVSYTLVFAVHEE